MGLVTREGMLKSLGICVLVLGILVLANIASLTQTYVDYYSVLEEDFVEEIGLVWLGLIFHPLSGIVMGLTLCVIGRGMIRLRKWSRILAVITIYINLFNLGCWVYFTNFIYITKGQFIEVLLMYMLIITFMNLKWIKESFV